MQIIATIIRANPVRGGMGGPNWYPLVVSGGNPICPFRQFLAKTYRFARIQNVTDRRQTDRRHAVAKARPIVRSAKKLKKNKLLKRDTAIRSIQIQRRWLRENSQQILGTINLWQE